MWHNKHMRAYSQDLRHRIVHAVEQGMPRAEIVKTFAVSRSTIKRYLKLRRETGGVSPKTIPGRPSKKGAALQAGLLPQLEAHPDVVLTRKPGEGKVGRESFPREGQDHAESETNVHQGI